MTNTKDMPDDFVSWVVSGNSNIPAGTRWDGRIVQSHLLAWQAATARATAIERERCAVVCDSRFVGDLNREDLEARRCAAAIRQGGDT